MRFGTKWGWVLSVVPPSAKFQRRIGYTEGNEYPIPSIKVVWPVSVQVGNRFQSTLPWRVGDQAGAEGTSTFGLCFISYADRKWKWKKGKAS